MTKDTSPKTSALSGCGFGDTLASDVRAFASLT